MVAAGLDQAVRDKDQARAEVLAGLGGRAGQEAAGVFGGEDPHYRSWANSVRT
jgi:hypothetical protein